MDTIRFIKGRGERVIAHPLRDLGQTTYPLTDQFWYGIDETMLTPKQLVKHYAHWVYVCASKNASAVSSVPLKLYTAPKSKYKYLRKGIDTKAINTDKEEVVNHPFLDLWREVNSFYNGFEMLEYLQLYLELTGDAYLYVLRNNLGLPQELWVLPSQWVKIVPDKTNFLKGYIYGVNETTAVALKPHEVVHFRFPNPESLYYGRSPLEAAFTAVKRKELQDDYENSLLKNDARPDFLLAAKAHMTENQKESLRTQWQQLYGSKRGRGKPAVSTADLEVKELNFRPKDISYLKGQEFTMREILATFGIPISAVNPEFTNRASARVAEYHYVKNTIVPRLNRIADKLNEDLIISYDPKLWVEFENPVPQDKELQMKEYETLLKGGVITINEIREELGKEPVEWGDEPHPWQSGIQSDPKPEEIEQETIDGET